MDDQTDERGFRLLFVCTGNTCRSPMAEAIARAAARAREWDGLQVRSAGVGAIDGDAVSGGAVRAAASRDIDISAHQAQRLEPELADWADLILVMSPSHLMRVVQLGAGDRAALLTAFATGGEAHEAIPDPIGGPDEEYVHTFEHLEALIERVFERIEPAVTP